MFWAARAIRNRYDSEIAPADELAALADHSLTNFTNIKDVGKETCRLGDYTVLFLCWVYKWIGGVGRQAVHKRVYTDKESSIGGTLSHSKCVFSNLMGPELRSRCAGVDNEAKLSCKRWGT